jgi:hypothetical protein
MLIWPDRHAHRLPRIAGSTPAEPRVLASAVASGAAAMLSLSLRCSQFNTTPKQKNKIKIRSTRRVETRNYCYQKASRMHKKLWEYRRNLVD